MVSTFLVACQTVRLVRLLNRQDWCANINQTSRIAPLFQREGEGKVKFRSNPNSQIPPLWVSSPPDCSTFGRCRTRKASKRSPIHGQTKGTVQGTVQPRAKREAGCGGKCYRLITSEGHSVRQVELEVEDRQQRDTNTPCQKGSGTRYYPGNEASRKGHSRDRVGSSFLRGVEFFAIVKIDINRTGSCTGNGEDIKQGKKKYQKI